MVEETFSKLTVAKILARLGAESAPLSLFVGEDLCFGPTVWIDVGELAIHAVKASEIEPSYDTVHAVRFGGYAWTLPSSAELMERIKQGLTSVPDIPDEKGRAAISEKVAKAFFEGLQDALRRTNLLKPVFDAGTTRMMPPVKPMTIVMDTCAVHQGGLSFASRYLTPHGRIKVPAVVHMEIVQQSDNYFKGIRFNRKARQTSSELLKDSQRANALRYHLLSQGGQRALLRIELAGDQEVERGDLPDPLRGIVQNESDQEDVNLGLQRVVRSFADRLIVETARRVQSLARPGHKVSIMTSDQGMVRMCLAEGLDVLFFHARSVPGFAGRRLTGAMFHPFQTGLDIVPLTDVLWELTVSFGGVRVLNKKTNAWIELYGIGLEDTIPFGADQILEDLLRGRYEFGEETKATRKPRRRAGTQPAKAVETRPVGGRNRRGKLPSFDINPNTLLKLVALVHEQKRVSRKDAQIALGAKIPLTVYRHERFLKAGEFIQVKDEVLMSEPSLEDLWSGLVREEAAPVLDCLLRIPSFRELHRYIIENRRVPSRDADLPIAPTSREGYFQLGEAAEAWYVLAGDEVYVTDRRPQSREFVPASLSTFERLREQQESEWVLAGAWLEEMVREHAIHPSESRRRLREAEEKGVMRVLSEGSSPDRRFDKHTLYVIRTYEENPRLVKLFLYHGDFIKPGVASVRIQLTEANNAA